MARRWATWRNSRSRNLELGRRCGACGALHASGRAGEIDVCARCCTTIPHPALVAGSLLLHGKTVRRLLPAVERLIYLSKLPGKLLRPPAAVAPRADLVQIGKRPDGRGPWAGA